jgi:hypothetical protein
MMLLHSHTNTQSLCFSGFTLGFPPRGAAVCATAVCPHFWNYALLLALSRYSTYHLKLPKVKCAIKYKG